MPRRTSPLRLDARGFHNFHGLVVTVVAVLLAVTSHRPALAATEPDSPQTGAWSAPEGTEPCASEDLLQRRLTADPSLRARMDLFEQLVQQAERQGLLQRKSGTPNSTASTPTYVIPIVVHIVHQGGAENVSDLQVQSQIYALNRDFANLPANPSPAVNTTIQFCLASQLPPASTVVWSTTPGITRDNSPETNHTYGNLASETALKAISFLPSAKYLNIWVVKTIAGGGGGVAGYATFPGTVPATLDGIVMRYDCFGSNSTPYGGPYVLLPTNNLGKILTHEAGHYLNVLHTFHGGCVVPGDNVSDTPPEAVNRSGCPFPVPSSCTAAPDPVENFMDYTNDVCRFAFTAGQTTRMQTAIATYRGTLVSAANLLSTGCSSGLNALITATPGQVCAGGTVQFSTPASGSGYTYAWSFPGGSPATANTQTATVTYPTAGAWPVTLTVTDGGPNFSTNTTTIYATACLPILGTCTNWVFGYGCALSFATGTPVPVSGRLNVSAEPGAMISDASGNLLFYSDGLKVYDAANNIMPNSNGLLGGYSTHNGAIVCPRPGSSTQYFLFTIRQWEDGPTANPVNYSVVDMTLNAGMGDIPAGQKNLLVSLPGSPTSMVEGQALIPHCNGVDWWYITNGDGSASGKIFVTLVTAAGPGATTVHPIGMTLAGVPAGAITPTPDGTKFAMANLSSKQIAAYNFDRATGAVTTLLAPMAVDAWMDVSLSPNGKLIYYSYYTGSVYGVRQMDIATLQVREITTNETCGIKPGPDGKIYVSPGGSTAIHCINFPNNFNTLNINECGLNKNSVPLPLGAADAIYGALPNFVLQCNGATFPSQFTYTVTNCTTVNFHAVNCSGPYSWTFGDAGTGSGQNVTHVYSSPGVYTVTLTVPSASPSVSSQTLTLQMQPVSLAGSNTACSNPNNYSMLGPAGYTYTWTVTGGAPATATGDNVDITWGTGGGTITVVATDPLTGCSTTLVKNVGRCPTCAKPPLGMVAWWPLDEPSGSTALETVLGNNAADLNAPAHVVGEVMRARQFNGTTQDLEANDAPGLNFGTGDLSMDAWIKTSAATGIQPIVDKRFPDPEAGYAMYLRDGRLAFRLAEPSTFSGTEYWSNTTPFIADGQWHHVAAVEKRSAVSNGSRLYVDGTPVVAFPAFTSTGSVTNAEKLRIGKYNTFSPNGPMFNGQIDEVELFNRALTTADVLAIYQADALGKCKEYCYVPASATFCRDASSITLTMLVCNYTTAAQTYSLAFTGLPMGGSCTWNGPASFTVLSANPVTVPANSCVPIQYKVIRPVGMPLYTTTCYQVTMTNTTSSYTTTGVGSVYLSRQWCNVVIGPVKGWGNVGSGSTLRFMTTNTSTTPVTMSYVVRAVPTDGASDDLSGISFNGLDADVPYPGVVTLAPGDSAAIDISAKFTQARAFRAYDIVLSADEDGDGVAEAQASATLRYQDNLASTVSAPLPKLPPRTLAMSVMPNPTRNEAVLQFWLPTGGPVEIGLYDIVGRRVKTLLQATREAGPGSLVLDSRTLPRGVYFVRLRTAGAIAVQRVVMVQ